MAEVPHSPQLNRSWQHPGACRETASGPVYHFRLRPDRRAARRVRVEMRKLGCTATNIDRRATGTEDSFKRGSRGIG